MSRIFVLFGQFGVAGTLPRLAVRLQQFGKTTTHQWDDPRVLQYAREAVGKVFLIGYSLGANEVAYLCGFINRIDGIVAYDPSRQSPLARNGQQAVSAHCKRAVCYWNPGTWLYGGARLVGPAPVELVRIDQYHLAVPYNQSLHDKTFGYISAWHNQ